MKWIFSIFLFVACLNLAVGAAIALSLPGMAYIQGGNPGNATEYEEHFNATEIAEGWGAEPYSNIPILGDLYSGFQFLIRNVQYLIDGFPLFLNWLNDSYITDYSASLAFQYISYAMRAIYAILASVFVISYITGREIMS